jgi:glutathione S-transferase
MSLKLYFSPGACSFVPHVLLELAGAEFEPCMVKLHKGEQYSPEYKALNPQGQVPVLVTHGTPLTQILAIVLHVDALFPRAQLLPQEPLPRAQAISVLAWMNNTLHPAFMHVFMPQKFADQADAQAVIKAHNTEVFRDLLGQLQAKVEAALAQGHAWLGGAGLGPLDAYTLTLARWGTMAGIAPSEHPALWAFVAKVAAHPAVARVMARERLQLNMLA